MIITVIYENRSKKQTNQNLIKAINYIKQNYNQEISLETVSKNVYVSNYYLSHLFREELDMTFSDYLNKTRIEQSINLMKENGLNIQEIAAKVGFNDANYFTKTFKKYYGVTPKNYMNVYVTLKQNE
jgi:two-component system response regulator YesN